MVYFREDFEEGDLERARDKPERRGQKANAISSLLMSGPPRGNDA